MRAEGKRGSEEEEKNSAPFTLSRRRRALKKARSTLLFSSLAGMRRLASLATAQTAAAGSQFVQKSKLGAVGAFFCRSFVVASQIFSTGID